MTVPRLQGWFDEIKDPLENIAKAFDYKFNYNKKLQLAMQQEIARNPQLMQQFADLRARDPNILKKMGLENVDFMIGGLPESSGSIKDKQTAGYLKGPTTPKEQEQIRANALGVRDPLEQQDKELDIDTGIFNKLLRETLFPTTVAKAGEEKLSAEQNIELLKTAPIAAIARAKLKGDYANYANNPQLLTPEEYTAISTHPSYKEGFENLRDDYWKKRQEEFTLMYRRTGRTDNLLDDWAKQVALYGGTTPLAARTFATLDPDEQKRLMESTQPANPQEEMLWRAAQGIGQLNTKNDVALQKNIIDAFYKDATFINAVKTLSNKETSKNKVALTNAINTANSVAIAKANELGFANPPQFEVSQTGIGPWKKFQAVLTSGDLSVARAIADRGGFEINTKSEDAKKAIDEKIAGNEEIINGAVEEVKKDLANMKTQKEKDDYLASLVSKYGALTAAAIRNKLDAPIKR